MPYRQYGSDLPFGEAQEKGVENYRNQEDGQYMPYVPETQHVPGVPDYEDYLNYKHGTVNDYPDMPGQFSDSPQEEDQDNWDFR